MLNVTVLAVGGLKEKFFSDACDEYQKRLNSFCKLTILELDEYRIPQNPSTAEIEKCLDVECKAIMAKLPPKAFVIPLCIEGKQLTSPQLAEKIEKIALLNSQLALIIGSSHGLSQQIKQRGDFALSFSAMTFPHQLTRVMLLEQLYRAFSINSGLKYHK